MNRAQLIVAMTAVMFITFLALVCVPGLGAQQTAAKGTAQPLILQEGDGEHLLRRPKGQTPAAGPGVIPEFIIKIDKQNGAAEDFVMLTEDLKPGAIINFHKHHNAEEVLIFEKGGATVTVGDKRAVAGPHSIVFIPRETWVSVTNTADHPIHLYALFSRPGFEGIFELEAYILETS